jgi:glucose/arabinose dehydrogenase
MHRKNIVVVLVSIAIAIGIAVAIYYVNLKSNDGNTNTPPSTGESAGIVTIAENLDTPWSIAFYGDTALVSSRDTGQILEINNSNRTSRVVGTVLGSVHRGEGGLLGLAVDSQRRLYAYHTTASDNRVSRFILGGAPGKLSLGEPEVIIDKLPSASIHNGGRIAFGPDNLLYVTVGDAGDTSSAQDLTRLGGKILRMTSDGDVPAGNPFPNSFVYSYGHRNPQGLAWSEDGTMYASEFGQNAWDELNIIKAGSNYGWPNVEGIEERNGYVVPVQQWATRDASPSGLAYTGGLLYIANLRGERLRTVPINNLGMSEERYSGDYGRIRDVTVAPNGRVWFVTNNTDGRGTPRSSDDRIFSIRQTF